MKLENVTAHIRPRSHWESIDLGCALVRRNFGSILFTWMITVIPMWVIFLLVTGRFMTPGWHLFSGVCFCWGTLSIADRVPLIIISRDLFGEKISPWQVAVLWWSKLIYKQFFSRVISRFSMKRGLTLPVSELEGLRGANYSSRVKLLSMNGGDGVVQAAMVSLLLVALLVASCYLFLAMFYQLYGESEVLTMMLEDLGRQSGDYSAYWLMFLFYLMMVSLMEPFFVGTGFAIYINSRTVTEGWDIELAFKRMSERIRNLNSIRFNRGLNQKPNDKIGASKGILIVVITSCLWLGAGSVDPIMGQDARVENILKDEAFKVHRSTYEEYVSNSSKKRKTTGGESGSSRSSDSLLSSFTDSSGFFAVLLQVFFYVIIAATIVGIVWMVYKNRYALKQGLNSTASGEKSRIKEVMGMDVTPESLPNQLQTEALDAWNRGEHHLALSLLYRGAISWMVNTAEVPIVGSDTEQDCLQRVAVGSDSALERYTYFYGLTTIWQGLAYGKRLPSDQDVMKLCGDWPFQQNGAVKGGRK